MIKLFKRHGWKPIRVKGSHYTFKKGNLIEQIPHHTKELRKGLEMKLFKKLQEGEK
ncbi:MAG: type II toxin-antitoxin system HicA family toxin [Candidatus Eremiobacteraeota bacterium]|nr:type II toxin-antitoxin system HicA family toxin [Candidatus Eremiobacteraeota bacterium]